MSCVGSGRNRQDLSCREQTEDSAEKRGAQGLGREKEGREKESRIACNYSPPLINSMALDRFHEDELIKDHAIQAIAASTLNRSVSPHYIRSNSKDTLSNTRDHTYVCVPPTTVILRLLGASIGDAVPGHPPTKLMRCGSYSRLPFPLRRSVCYSPRAEICQWHFDPVQKYLLIEILFLSGLRTEPDLVPMCCCSLLYRKIAFFCDKSCHGTEPPTSDLDFSVIHYHQSARSPPVVERERWHAVS